MKVMKNVILVSNVMLVRMRSALMMTTIIRFQMLLFSLSQIEPPFLKSSSSAYDSKISSMSQIHTGTSTVFPTTCKSHKIKVIY